MRILKALKILEDAVLDCRERAIDTPQTRQALDSLERGMNAHFSGKRSSLADNLSSSAFVF